MAKLLRAWLTLIKERFSPFTYLPMIILFVAGNGLYLARNENFPFQQERFILTLCIIASAFFRLRLFDEIKDYEVDVRINPTRPLARGVLSIKQVRSGIALCLLFELLLAWFLGPWAFWTHVIAIFFSLLMFEEFFIGDLLRPHLTTYAITHTFVSVLLGVSSAVLLTNANPMDFHLFHWLFFLSNWAFFNLFEFARKTYSHKEERPTVPSYSKIFGITGAWFLSISEALIGLLLIWTTLRNPLNVVRNYELLVAIFAIYFVFTLPYLVFSKEKQAQLFRGITGIYLLAHYAGLIFLFGSHQ